MDHAAPAANFTVVMQHFACYNSCVGGQNWLHVHPITNGLAMTQARIDPQLKQTLQAQPAAEFLLLLRVYQIDVSHSQALVARGVTIRRSLTLTPTFAVTCSGAVGLGLLDLPWIRSVEEDRPVYAL